MDTLHKNPGIMFNLPYPIHSTKAGAPDLGKVMGMSWEGDKPFLLVEFTSNLGEIAQGLTPQMVITTFAEAGITIREAVPEQAAPPQTTNPQVTAPPPGGGSPWPDAAPPATEAAQELPDFPKLQEDLWREIIRKGCGADTKKWTGVGSKNEITPEKYLNVKAFVDQWEPPSGKGGRKKECEPWSPSGCGNRYGGRKAPPASGVTFPGPASSEAAALPTPSAGNTGASRESMIVRSKLTKRFRIVLDECFKLERPEVRNPDRRWYEQIPCRGGAFISLYSETAPTLQLSTPRAQNAKNIWQQIKHKPCCRADFHFDGEAILFFPPEQLDVVAEGAEARVKRQGRPMTSEQKAQLAAMDREALKKYRDANAPGSGIEPRIDADAPPKG